MTKKMSEVHLCILSRKIIVFGGLNFRCNKCIIVEEKYIEKEK